MKFFLEWLREYPVAVVVATGICVVCYSLAALAWSAIIRSDRWGL
jgi:hypothetical protein